MNAHRRTRGALFVVLPAILASGCGIVLGLGDYSDGTDTTSTSGNPQVCTPGDQKKCLYTGLEQTEDVGRCHAGTQVCNKEGTGYDECAGEVLPAAKEDCGNNVDDDCNGMINDGCPCAPGTMQHCYTGPASTENVGICVGGMATCKPDGTGYGACEGEQTPITEDCATTADDDCDGVPNQASAGCNCEAGSIASCYTGPANTENVGICAPGSQTCNPDGLGYGPCTGDVTPLAEDCATPEDEDCDGVVNQAAAGCVCTPGTSAPCYSGPAGTENVGLCHGGTHTCNADGKGYGACGGEVIPAVENCSNAIDEDCDGSLCGQTQWAKALPGMTVSGVAVDGAGNIYVTGGLFDVFTMGAVTLTPVGSTDIVVLKFNSAGTIQWGKRFGSASSNGSNAIAVDAAGNVHITGYVGGSVDFGGGAISAGVFVAKFSTAGVHTWSRKCLGSTSSPVSMGTGIALDGTGDVLVSGTFGGSLSCAVGQSASGAGSSDVFAIRMSGANGGPIWTKGFGDAGLQTGAGIAADANGDALLTGQFFGSMNFGGGNLTATANGSIYVAKLTSAAGAHVWSKSGNNTSIGTGIAVDASNNAIITGVYNGPMTLGGKTVASNGGGNDILFGRLDAATGNAAWLNGYGGANGDAGLAVAVAPNGRLTMGGHFRNSANFGGGALASASLDAAYLATFDSTPGHLWSKQFSSATLGANNTNAVAFGPSNEVVAGGQVIGNVDYGSGVVNYPANGGSFLMRVAR